MIDDPLATDRAGQHGHMRPDKHEASAPGGGVIIALCARFAFNRPKVAEVSRRETRRGLTSC